MRFTTNGLIRTVLVVKHVKEVVVSVGWRNYDCSYTVKAWNKVLGRLEIRVHLLFIYSLYSITAVDLTGSFPKQCRGSQAYSKRPFICCVPGCLYTVWGKNLGCPFSIYLVFIAEKSCNRRRTMGNPISQNWNSLSPYSWWPQSKLVAQIGKLALSKSLQLETIRVAPSS